MEGFDADVQLLPQWVQIWMDIIGMALVVSSLVFVFNKSTRKLALFVVLSTVASAVLIVWMHSQMGMVRLLGVVHFFFFGPLVFYMVRRLKSDPPPGWQAAAMTGLVAILSVMMLFDLYDVVRWVLGARAPIV